MLLKRPKNLSTISINPKIGRSINRVLILNSIREKQPISRVKISEITGLNKSTVSSIVSSLIDENLVVEDVDRNQEIGRNPLNLRVKKGENFVGALYFDSVRTEIAIVDVDGEIIRRDEMRTSQIDPALFVNACIDKMIDLHKNTSSFALRGIGITVAGIVDSGRSTVIYAPNLGWNSLDMSAVISKRMPEINNIVVENDAKASALAELTIGTHNIKPSNFVFLSIGLGIGAGIVLDDHILSGHSHAAGEFGHMTIIEHGEQCSCGNRGCWEMYASDRATIRRYGAKKGLSSEQISKLFLEDVIIAANMQDVDAKESIQKTAHYIGIGIANIVRSFDPEYIIIGGPITQAWDIMYPIVAETMHNSGFVGYHQNLKILPTSLSANPPLLGAAALSIREIFTDYRIAL